MIHFVYLDPRILRILYIKIMSFEDHLLMLRVVAKWMIFRCSFYNHLMH